jgi:acyl carrier protein
MSFKLFNSRKKISSSTSIEELVFQKVREILPHDIKGIELKPEIKFAELGIDSVKYINLLYGLEDILNMDIEEIADQVDLYSINTIGDVIQLAGTLNIQK